jgi:hypothetical protein
MLTFTAKIICALWTISKATILVYFYFTELPAGLPPFFLCKAKKKF